MFLLLFRLWQVCLNKAGVFLPAQLHALPGSDNKGQVPTCSIHMWYHSCGWIVRCSSACVWAIVTLFKIRHASLTRLKLAARAIGFFSGYRFSSPVARLTYSKTPCGVSPHAPVIWSSAICAPSWQSAHGDLCQAFVWLILFDLDWSCLVLIDLVWFFFQAFRKVAKINTQKGSWNTWLFA